MKALKKTLFALYIIVLVCMGAATIIEKYRGTDFVSDHVYGAWWFTAVWALLAATSILYFLKTKVRCASVVALHLAFIVILAGAFLTHVSARRGMVHLRQGVPVDTYLENAGEAGVKEYKLPFTLNLTEFSIRYHNGTTAEQDYESRFTITEGDKTTQAEVSMNNIYSYRSFRFYQSSYDPDMRGSVLSLNSDPWGIPVTYTGYGLLFLSLLWMLIDPKGAFRHVLGSPLLKKGALSIAAVMCFGAVQAAPVLPKETAEKFGHLNILYNNRICPLQTFAIDFTKKLCGSARYEDYTPEQVLTGFVFWGDEWSKKPVLKLKNGEMRRTLQLPEFVSVNSFFNQDLGGYTIGPYVQEYLRGNTDDFHKQVGDVDDRLQLIMELRKGALLKVFPCTAGGHTTWYAPTDKPAEGLDSAHVQFIQNVFNLLGEEARAGNYAGINAVVDKILKYQTANGGTSLPSPTQTKAERIYNAVPFATILFMVNLTMGFLTLFLSIRKLTAGKPGASAVSPLDKVFFTVMSLSFLALTACLALRWIVSGTVPMANGYETMLFMSWLIMLCSVLLYRSFHIILTFGFIMSGFFLLVSHINRMDPQISHIMPVLNSPLLSVHVSVVMMSFAMLSLTFICGAMALALRLAKGRDAAGLDIQLESLRALSDLFLYPALAALGFGIFIGAIWANMSWGTYWSWDAKEVWGLITFMIYGISVHRTTLPWLRGPLSYHVFMVVAFLSILMTYFGVNYFLGGMHSYA